MRRRILSGMLALCLLLCLTPATVLAEESSEPANYSQVSNDGEDNPGIVVNANGGDEEILSDEENSVQPDTPAGEDGDTGAGDENVSQDPAQPDDQDGNDAGDQPGAPAGEDDDAGEGDENVPQDPAQSDEQDGTDTNNQDSTPAGEDDDAGEGDENVPQTPAPPDDQDGDGVNVLTDAPAFFSTYTGKTQYDAATESQLEEAVEAANDAARQATATSMEIPQITIRLTADINLNNGTKTGAYYSLTDGANVHLTSSGNYKLSFDNSHTIRSGVYFFKVDTDSSLTLSNITLDCNSAGQADFKSGALYVNGAHLYIQDGARIINSNVRGYSSTVINLIGSTCVMSGGEISGLGLLPVETEFASEKHRTRMRGTVLQAGGVLAPLSGAELEGYEIHMGRTERANGAKPLVRLENGLLDGCQQGNVYGSYLHGFFDTEACRKAVLGALAAQKGVSLTADVLDRRAYKESQYDLLAKAVRENLDMQRIYRILEQGI